jgi:hypothetical protein
MLNLTIPQISQFLPGRSGPGTFQPLNLRLRTFRASHAQMSVMQEFSRVVDLSELARISIVSKFYKQIHDVSNFFQKFSKFVVPK